MSIFRDEISVNDFKHGMFNAYELAESVVIRRYPKIIARASGNQVAGEITSITIDTAGEGYGATPSYSVSGTGTSLVLDVITLTGGAITGISIASSSSDWTGPATIQFTGGYLDTTLNAVIVRQGVSKVNGRLNITEGLKASFSRSDYPDLDTGRDKIILKKRLDDASTSEAGLVNILIENSAMYTVQVK